MSGPTKGSTQSKNTSLSASTDSLVGEAQRLYRSGKNAELLGLSGVEPSAGSEAAIRLRILRGMARFDLGNVVGSITDLNAAVDESRALPASVQFAATFALFLRESDYVGPDGVIPHLTQLRQLASRAGDAASLAALHLAVARVEGCRGHCSSAHHHLEIARGFVERGEDVAL